MESNHSSSFCAPEGVGLSGIREGRRIEEKLLDFVDRLGAFLLLHADYLNWGQV